MWLTQMSAKGTRALAWRATRAAQGDGDCVGVERVVDARAATRAGQVARAWKDRARATRPRTTTNWPRCARREPRIPPRRPVPQCAECSGPSAAMAPASKTRIGYRKRWPCILDGMQRSGSAEFFDRARRKAKGEAKREKPLASPFSQSGMHVLRFAPTPVTKICRRGTRLRSPRVAAMGRRMATSWAER